MGADAATVEHLGLEVTESSILVGEVPITMRCAGAGRPLLVLHDELGFPGWLRWTRELAAERQLCAPVQPGFALTPRISWARDYRDVASLYLRMVRELELAPVDIVGFSAGGYLAAEMAAACPEAVNHLALVAPLGLKPDEGEIFDFFAVTARRHLAATVSLHDVSEMEEIYGGNMTPEQFELFEAARAETCRLGWEPFMHSPSLGERLKAVRDVQSLIIWGEDDKIVPVSSMHRFRDALTGARLETLPGCGHRPETEAPAPFLEILSKFLAS
jgi:pimeloyl-ACP methyl ester carboxylesterase